MVAVPAVGTVSPSSSRMLVVFPEPFGPRNAVIRPGATSAVRSSRAVTAPNFLVSPSNAMTADMATPTGGEATTPGCDLWLWPGGCSTDLQRGRCSCQALGKTPRDYDNGLTKG